MFTLPVLPYSFEALEPYIDAKTMEIHYLKHHQTYVDKLNETLKDHPDLLAMDITRLLTDITAVPEAIRQKTINFGGGHANHTFFWNCMAPKTEADSSWFAPYKEEFIQKGTTFFGSGWVWLVRNKEKFEIITTTNQDSPLSQGKTPVLGLDLWEHAYYLKYQNKRADYIAAWFNVINWKGAKKIFDQF